MRAGASVRGVYCILSARFCLDPHVFPSIYLAKTKLRGQAATLERLRVDWQLEEALAHGPDPLHLAAAFGLDRYLGPSPRLT